MRKKAILFDLDGTLINSYKLIITSYQFSLQRILGLKVSDEEIIRYIGEPLEITMKRYGTHEQVPELIKEYRS